MPELSKILTEDDLKRGSGSGFVHLDLSPYLAIIDAATQDGGVGGVVQLQEGESQRAEKRRLSRAAKLQGYRLTWRTSEASQLRFVLSHGNEAPPGSRRRPAPRARSSAPAGRRSRKA